MPVLTSVLLGRDPLRETNKQCIADLRVTDPRDDKTRIQDTKGGLFKDSYVWVVMPSQANPAGCPSDQASKTHQVLCQIWSLRYMGRTVPRQHKVSFSMPCFIVVPPTYPLNLLLVPSNHDIKCKHGNSMPPA